MKNIFKKYNIWVNIAGFIAIFALILFFVVLPLQRSIRSNVDEIQGKIIDSDMNRSRISKIPEMEKVEASFAENKDNLKVILNNDNEVDFIKEVEALAEETGNKIDLKIDDTSNKIQKPATVKKDPEDIKSNLTYSKYLSMQINLEGDYVKALNFIHKLENMNHYVDVISLSMVKSQPDQTAAAVGANPFGVNNSSVNSGAGNGHLAAPVKITNVLKSSLGVVVYLTN